MTANAKPESMPYCKGMGSIRKLFTVLLLLAVIAATAAYCMLYIAFNLREPDNFVNRSFRKQVLRILPLRSALRMDQIGDARYAYAASPSLPLTAYVYVQSGVSLRPGALDTFAREVEPVTHKTLRTAWETPQVLYDRPDKVNDRDIADLTATYETGMQLLPRESPLFIFVLKYYLEHPSYAGLAVNADTIILFETAMENVSDTPEILEEVQASTLLHEFGHLLGADHIRATGCVMEDTVENLNFYRKLTGAHDSYCPQDIEAIGTALAD